MRPMKLPMRRAAAALCACALALSLSAMPAFAASEDYRGTTYTVTVYAGNQGTVDGGEQVVYENVEPGTKLDFSDITVSVPDDSKYYAKGIRLAALDNVRSDNIRNQEVAPTVYYANVDDDGVLVGAAEAVINEDTDFVVAYGIKANRVLYTVVYVDADGNELAPAQQFYGDVGDVPATAAAYVAGYVPRATLLTKTLVGNEAENVFTFTYDRLADGFVTEPNETGGVDVIAPDGSVAPDAYITEVVQAVPVATVVEGPAPADGADAAAAGAGAAGAGAAPVPVAAGEPLVTDNGTEVLDADGTPLAAPGEENLDDDATPLAGEQQPGEQQAAADMAWTPWAVAAALLLVAIVVVLVRARKQEQEPQQ